VFTTTAQRHDGTTSVSASWTLFFNGYTPQFFFRSTDATGRAELRGDAQMAMPGDNVSLWVELGKPEAIEAGTHFAIREGGRTIGSGVVTKLID
jgi:elongation factor Tu